MEGELHRKGKKKLRGNEGEWKEGENGNEGKRRIVFYI